MFVWSQKQNLACWGPGPCLLCKLFQALPTPHCTATPPRSQAANWSWSGAKNKSWLIARAQLCLFEGWGAYRCLALLSQLTACDRDGVALQQGVANAWNSLHKRPDRGWRHVPMGVHHGHRTEGKEHRVGSSSISLQRGLTRGGPHSLLDVLHVPSPRVKG